jgi:uncharacterized membrane protein
MERLADILTSKGIDLTGWELSVATAVSADGKTIVGYGINPAGEREAFVASIAPNPTTLLGDINFDGQVDGADLFLMQRAVAGHITLNAAQIPNADVYPVGAADEIITAQDLFILQGMVLAP